MTEDLPVLSLPALRRVTGRALTRLEARLQLEGTPISCKGVGCHGCCRGDVVVSTEELAGILASAPAEALDAALARADELLDEAQVETAWCPLLVDGACSVYDVRPLVCRMFAVTSPAEDCYGSGKDTTKVFPTREAMLTVFMMEATGGQRALLPELVHAARARVQER